MPRLFTYTVARDYGFAPNPFYGLCTLATCMPGIRKGAVEGDWIVGGGTKTKNRGGHIVYAMRVTEVMPFDHYWRDQRFILKRPDLYSSFKRAFGDNIYSRDPNTGRWLQADSHHSYENGQRNAHNVDHDTKADRILFSDDFIYWGGAGPKMPVFHGCDLYFGRGYKNSYSEEVVQEFIAWIRAQNETGYCGPPLEWG